jgi:hypothetical protein
MTDSGVPGFTQDQLEEYIGSGDIDPILKTFAGADSSAEIYELNGRFILKWTACDFNEGGIEALDTESLDEARKIAEVQAHENIGEWHAFDRLLELGTLAANPFGNTHNRFYPLPDGYSQVGLYRLEHQYDDDEVAKIFLYKRTTGRLKKDNASDGPSVLAFSALNGLVVGEFDSLEEAHEAVIEEPLGYTLEFCDLTDSEE